MALQRFLPVLAALALAVLPGCNGTTSDAPDASETPSSSATPGGAREAASGNGHAGSGGADGHEHDAGVRAASDLSTTPPAQDGEAYREWLLAAADRALTGAEFITADGIPIASSGRLVKPSIHADRPGYTPIPEEDLEVVRKGRRDVGRLEGELEGVATSYRELAEKVLHAVSLGDVDRLYSFLITREEFETFIWPEQPNSRPIANVPVESAWMMLHRSATVGARRGARDYEGMKLTLDRIEFETGLTPFVNYNLYRDMVLHCRTAEGERVTVDFCRTLIERDGQFKVYKYHD